MTMQELQFSLEARSKKALLDISSDALTLRRLTIIIYTAKETEFQTGELYSRIETHPIAFSNSITRLQNLKIITLERGMIQRTPNSRQLILKYRSQLISNIGRPAWKEFDSRSLEEFRYTMQNS